MHIVNTIFHGNKISVCCILRIHLVHQYSVTTSHCFIMTCDPAPHYEHSFSFSIIPADRRYHTHSLLLMPKLYFMSVMFLILEPPFCRGRARVAVNDQGIESCDKGASIKTRSESRLARVDGRRYHCLWSI